MQKKLEPLLPAHILGENFEAAESVQNLSVIFYCDGSFRNKQVDAVCRSCFVGLCDLQRI